MVETIYLTKEGYQKKKEELDDLINVQRPQIIKAVEVARAFGDLRENAEYDAARNEQGRIEDRIKELDALLRHAKILENDEAANSDVVVVGSKLVVWDEDMKEELELIIVNTVEADFDNGRISNKSLLGESLMGHVAGDVVEVKAPAGTSKFRIVRIVK